MTTITPSSYYQLSNLQSGTGSTGNSSTSSAGSSLTQTLVNSLAAVEAGSSQSGSGSNDAYSLNLSPAAQQLLNGSSTSNSSTSSSSSFTLTQAQQTTINDIIEKYKGQPLTQSTFNDIQNALEAAGLGADQLSAKDQISSFSPTSTLINDLNGNYTGLTTASTSAQTEQTKSTNYMQNILSAWKSENTASSSSASGVSSITA